MGEIGRDCREFLYEMDYCAIILIIRGYRRRNVLQYQLQRLQAYGAFHCMGAKNPKSPEDWLPLYVDRYIDSSMRTDITEDDIAELQAEIDAYNRTNENQEK